MRQEVEYETSEQQRRKIIENQRIIRIEDKVPFSLLISLSIRHMFVVFDTSVLMPLIFGINPAVVLFTDGVGTLLFIGVAKGEAPACLGFSFAFLAPVGVIISNLRYEYALGGFMAIGFCGCTPAFTVYRFGTEWIKVILPPTTMGPVVVLIGLELSGSATNSAGLLDEVLDPRKTIVFILTLGTAVSSSILFRRSLSVIPVLIVATVGYMSALTCGIVDFVEAAAAPVFTLSNFSTPKFNLGAIITILLALPVITSEYTGYQVVASKVVGGNLLKDPGLHRSLFEDNFSAMISGLIGSVSTTTHGENIGVMAIIHVYGVRVIAGVAMLSIVYSSIDKFSTLISTIPGPAIDNISSLLYDMTGASGPRIPVGFQMDYGNFGSLALTLVIFVTELSGTAVRFGNVQFTSMVPACMVGMTLSLIFHVLDYFKLTNNQQLTRRETPVRKCLTSAEKLV